MKKRSPASTPLARAGRRRAYTLVEMLMSVALTLIIMAFVVQMFGLVSDSVSDSRAILEMNDRLRWTTERLRKDLECATADMLPPLTPEAGKGYFELIEGRLTTQNMTSSGLAINANDPSNPIVDSTVIDKDDILLFTVRSRNAPFIGRAFVRTPSNPYGEQTSVESPLAEVCWFVRGSNLCRGIRLIKPEIDWDLTTPEQEPLDATLNSLLSGRGFYDCFDLSVRYDDVASALVPNTLADLTKRENRFARSPHGDSFPFLPQPTDWYYLGLPTLCECSHPAWLPGRPLPSLALTPNPDFPGGQFDAWNNPLPFDAVNVGGTATTLDPDTGTIVAISGPRVAEEVILSNVIGFDVKVWDALAPLISVGPNGTEDDQSDDFACLSPGDPGYTSQLYTDAINTQNGACIAGFGAYVDLGFGDSMGFSPALGSWFSETGNAKSGLSRVYDTWSTHYEKDGIDQDGDGLIDEGANGFDDIEDSDGVDSDGDGVVNARDGIVDDVGEQEAPPPYLRPLRGIQIRIRVFDPDSHQVREVKVTRDFLPE